MLAGTISQLAFAYRGLPHRGIPALAALVAGFAITRRAAHVTDESVAAANPPGWDLPLRMTVATGVVRGIIALAPVIGPHLAELLSPFPVFGVVMAVFTHRTHGPNAAADLDGLVMGLAAPAVFFLALTLALPSMGLMVFVVATLAALATQAGTMFVMPADRGTDAAAAPSR
ncbi:hypothetical protein ACIREE_27080 [Streptomyces sp. NPDC102467]|uniref:hypothetical protein n=1 Tax=Streptomyces sp. NPDC102467 TaxID=3366179 RepID=UPI0038011B0D